MQRTLAIVGMLLFSSLLATGCGTPAKDKRNERTADPSRRVALIDRLGPGAKIATAAGCTIETPPLRAARHTESAGPKDWSSTPPTSGAHNPSWAPWGRYEKVVTDEHLLHNFEHGGVGIWLGTGVESSDDLVAEIDDRLMKRGNKLVVTPRPSLAGIAAGSWGALLTCPPDAVAKLGVDGMASLLADWYKANESRETSAEKDVPPYTGPMTRPAPVKDISLPTPKF